MTRLKTKKNVTKKAFLLYWLREVCLEKNSKKFPDQSGDVMQSSIYFTNYRN